MQNLNVKQTIELLEDLGITGITEEMGNRIENSWSSIPEEVRPSLNIVAMLLSEIGGGHHDFQTGEWTPISNKVYSFDVEVFDVGNMYRLFFQGIQSISEGEFEITDVVDNAEEVDWENGSGVRKISFCFNQKPYYFEAKMMYDWFDVRLLGYMNEVLEKEGNPKRFYMMSDGYQEVMLFYCNEFWAKRFEKATGCKIEF